MCTTLPPGLFGDTLEMVWVHSETRLYAFYQGVKMPFNHLPPSIMDTLNQKMQQDTEAMYLFEKNAPHLQGMDKLIHYYRCRNGAYNMEPDMDEHGNFSAEHWDCGCHNCPLGELFHNKMEVENGVLTKRELHIIRTLCSAPYPIGAAAAGSLNISELTLNTHKSNIFRKTGLHSIQELTAWAHKNALV